MGSYLTRMLSGKDAVYSIGFTDFSGTAGRVYATPYDISLPAMGSLENWIAEKDFNYAFLNFQKDKSLQEENFIMRGQDHFQISARWMNIFDGIFYIKDMYPCQVN